MKTSFFKMGWTISIFFVVLYVICFSWQILLTDLALRILHLQLLALTFPGFVGFSFGSFVWGAVLSFVYGWIGAGIFVWLHNKFCCSNDRK